MHLLGTYEESTLASSGVRLLSSLLEAAIRQPPFKPHSHSDKVNKAQPHGGHPLAWPLEDRESIDAMWASKQSNIAEDTSRPNASQVLPSHEGSQQENTPGASNSGYPDICNAPMQGVAGLNVTSAEGSFGAGNEDSSLPDMAWWTDVFSDYFPTQSGFENPFVIEDLLYQAPS